MTSTAVKTTRGWSEVTARRLERHGLAQPVAAKRLAEQVGILCGAHAQIMTAAELSVGLRVSGITRADVQNALWNEHSLIKTFGPRGTVHLLRAQDLPLWSGALSAVPTQRGPTGQNALLTPEQTEAVIQAIATALRDAELTVDELTGAIVSLAGSWAGDLVMDAFQTRWPRWRVAMSAAADRGVLCFGAPRDRNVTYTNPARWLPGFQPAERQLALAWLVRQYLHAYGPATPQQFARWLSAPQGWAVTLFETLAGELQPVEMAGSLAWENAGETPPPPEPPQGLWLLPYFDAYVVGSYPRELLFPGRAGERAINRGQAGNYPVLLIDGTVAGVWHQRRSGKRIHLTVEPLEELSAPQRRALDEQVQRLGEIMEGTPELVIGPVTVGPHA